MKVLAAPLFFPIFISECMVNPLSSAMKHLILVRSGEPGGRPGRGWRNPVDYDLFEDSYIPRFEKCGRIIREKIGTASVHIVCSAVHVGQQTAQIIQSR